MTGNYEGEYADRLVDMLSAQRATTTAVQVDPAGFTDQDERIEYIRAMTLAVIAELYEMLDEVGWKPWATSRHINEDAAFSELRDALQFLMNLMFAVTLQPADELAHRLHKELNEKHVVNVQRARDGYDGVSSKCPQCKRDLGETEVHEVRATSTSRIDLHCRCGAYLGSRSV